MTLMKKFILTLALALSLLAIITPAFGLSVSVSGENEGQIASNSVNYNLDSTSSMTSSRRENRTSPVFWLMSARTSVS